MAGILLTLVALAIVVCVVRLPVRAPASRPRSRAGGAAAPAQLLEAERLVLGAAGSARFAHVYLRPVLAEAAAIRLAERGWTLATIPEPTARELFGERLWALIGPGRPPPGDQRGDGVSTVDLSEMLDALAAL